MNTRKEFKETDLVEIIFDDPAEFDTNYNGNDGPIECRAIGWLVDQNDKFVKMAWLTEENDDPYVGLSIPQGCIKKISHLNASPIHQIEVASK